MATILTHPVVPLTLGLLLGQKRLPRPLVLTGMLAVILPDLDVITFKLGIAYDSAFGHRGFSHSIVFAMLVASLVSIFHTRLRSSILVCWLFIAFATISHGLLDALTTGGQGVEFFWPLTEQRYFFPVQFIEVSPIGVNRFLTARGWRVIQSELLTVWLPCGLLLLSVKLAAYFSSSRKSS
ncbi:metal-dependent hydrolase [Undibacterium sp. TC4M20W]|uniref:metal-dependent hydrolase n=1 Tax=Undibacterium sp. TC4M20W TaxID=3413052 RepID=UPI003BF0E778